MATTKVQFRAYGILRAHREMDDNMLRERYRETIRDKHPDRGGDPDEFMLVASAYGLVKTRDARTRLEDWLDLHGIKCGKCSGTGTLIKTKGFVESEVRPCKDCGGCGFRERRGNEL